MTVGELKQHVEDWMNKFQVTVKYDPLEALKQLDNLGLLVTKQRGMITRVTHRLDRDLKSGL